jgi:Fe-S cluster assembly scaffold IscU
MQRLYKFARRSYSDQVLSHFNKPKNIGSFPKSDPMVGTAVVGSEACGDLIKFQIKVDSQGQILDAKAKIFGCASAISSTSYATEMIIGKSLEDASKVTNKQIQQALSLAPVKFHCSMLAQDAIQAAIEDYKRKAIEVSKKENVIVL